MRKRIFYGLTFNIILLGIVSLFTDISSEMLMPLLPFFLISLGATTSLIGLIEGIADSTASILKVISGYWSDKIRKKKIFVVFGYGTSAASKLLLPFSFVWYHVLGARFGDRVGKGLRTAPRDAIIASSAVETEKGKAFGFHRAMDSLGAVLGPAIALLIFPIFLYRKTFGIAMIPAVAAVLLALFIREKKYARSRNEYQRFTISSLKLNKKFKFFMVASLLFSLGNFSYAFMLLRAGEILNLNTFGGKIEISTVAVILLLYILFNIVYTALAMPFGILSDKIGRRKTIILGYCTAAVMFLGFALANSLPACIVLFAVYGISQAINETAQRAFVSDLTEEKERGTGFGVYHTIVGLAALPSSLIAGFLWQYISSTAAFLFGFGMCFAAVILFAPLGRKYYLIS